MVNIRIARVQNPEDLKLKAEPYMIKGRMKVSFINEKWNYEIINFPKVVQDEVQPVDYDFEKYATKYLILGAYCDEKCVGFALVEKESRTRYLYELTKIMSIWVSEPSSFSVVSMKPRS